MRTASASITTPVNNRRVIAPEIAANKKKAPVLKLRGGAVEATVERTTVSTAPSWVLPPSTGAKPIDRKFPDDVAWKEERSLKQEVTAYILTSFLLLMGSSMVLAPVQFMRWTGILEASALAESLTQSAGYYVTAIGGIACARLIRRKSTQSSLAVGYTTLLVEVWGRMLRQQAQTYGGPWYQLEEFATLIFQGFSAWALLHKKEYMERWVQFLPYVGFVRAIARIALPSVFLLQTGDDSVFLQYQACNFAIFAYATMVYCMAHGWDALHSVGCAISSLYSKAVYMAFILLQSDITANDLAILRVQRKVHLLLLALWMVVQLPFFTYELCYGV